MSLSLDNGPVNPGGQTSQLLGWPHPVNYPMTNTNQKHMQSYRHADLGLHPSYPNTDYE